MKIMKTANNFTKGKIFSPLVRFALPVLLAMFLQSMYGAVDTLIVGQFGSAADVSAVATGGGIMQTITMAIVGISMGTTILLGQRIGEGRTDKAGDVIGSSILLFLIIGLGVTVLMEIFTVPAAQIMQAPEEAFGGTVSYVRICSAGTIFIIAYNVLGSVFRGMGNSKMPLITVAISCVLNIGGDILLVGVFKMAAAGAAIATVASQAVSVVLSILIIKKQGLPFEFGRKNLKLKKEVVLGVTKLGLPIALQDVLVSVSFLAITAIVNSLGVIASAGVGVAERICGFIMLVPSAYSQSISAFVAQNIGAKKPERAKKALFYGISTSLVVGVAVAYLSFFHGDMLSGMFSSDLQVISASADYLKAYAIDCLLVSFMFCFVGYFNGCGRTTFVMVQGIIGAFLVRIPVSYFMSLIKPVSLTLVGLATPASTFVQIILFVTYFIVVSKSTQKNKVLVLN